MAKMMTPAMERINKKNEKVKKSGKQSTPWTEAWKRLKKNKLAMVSLVVFVLLILIALFPGLFATHDYAEQDYNAVLQKPSMAHFFGTDNFGRDIFSRVIYGTRISLSIGICCVMISLVVGGALGAIAAFKGGKVDNVIMRFMDVFQAIPRMLMAISIAAALGTGMGNLMLAIGIGSVPIYARVVRAAVLTVRDKDYIEAAKAIGAGSFRQVMKYMIPNALGPIIVQATFGVAGSILLTSSLSYIGLGIAPPTPEWGSMLSAGRQYMQQAMHIVLFPGLAIMLTIFSLNVLGDGLRDALDPKLK